MYATTGFTYRQILDLTSLMRPFIPVKQKWNGRRMKLTIHNQIVATLAYLRNNTTQDELAERFDVSQPTISRIITRLTSVIERALADWVPTGDDLDPRNSYIVDGTLVPAWSWSDYPEDYSGKHHTTGLNLQVACDTVGRLAWISDPLPGSTHDAKAIRESNILEKGGASYVGDKGYIGLGMITPIKKKPGQIHLSERDKVFNREIHEIRYVIERAISHLKNWRILHTDYRRPHRTHPQTITAVISLHFYKLSL
ncbi:MAG: transposase [Propionibacteriaceae bacterium]|jgi:hypothetical protein|nr:transposase [Propionibacteriaceae bacterium]